MNQAIIDEIQSANHRIIAGIKLSVPELFQDPDFQDYVNNTNVMTWHDKKGPIDEDDLADVVVFVDPSMTGEGTDTDMPYWDVIFEKVLAIVGPTPRSDDHIAVVLTNC